MTSLGLLSVALIAAAATMFGGMTASAQGPAPQVNVVQRVSEVVPVLRSVSVRTDEVLLLRVDVVGQTGAILADEHLPDVTWSATGGSLTSSTLPETTYTSPSSPGRYTVTASVPMANCLPEGDCEAQIQIDVSSAARSGLVEAAPQNPSGVIPSSLADVNGAQYSVFTPEEGGEFLGNGWWISADPGAVADRTLVGLRMEDVGPVNGDMESIGSHSFAGNYYMVYAISRNGESPTSLRLQEGVNACVPMPEEFGASLANTVMIATRDDGSLTQLTTRQMLQDGNLFVCGRLSSLPARLAVAKPLSAIVDEEIEMPEQPETQILPDTGAADPGQTVVLLAMVVGALLLATGAAGVTLTAARRRSQ